MDKYPWLQSLKQSITVWLDEILDVEQAGMVPFCLQGMLITPDKTTGLGASSLALKLASQINHWETLDETYKTQWVVHIKQFQNPRNGYFEDINILKPADRRAGWLWFKKDRGIRRAETRQSIAALDNVGQHANHPMPESDDVLAVVKALPWHRGPWHAASQTSHLLYFLNYNQQHFDLDRQDSINAVLAFLESIADPQTGSWHTDKVNLKQQVNGAMKMVTILDLFDLPMPYPKASIDTALNKEQNIDACHKLDALVVLHRAAQQTDYRKEDIRHFADDMLAQIGANHAAPDGGLSFFPRQANTHYYGLEVTQGLNVSGLHGSHLLVWAITLCADLLGFYESLGWTTLDT